MQLERLQTFCKELSRLRFPGVGLPCEVYRQSGDHWEDMDGSKVGDDRLCEHLRRALELGKDWQPRNSKRSFHPIVMLRCVVICESHSSPRAPRRGQIQQQIVDCLRNSNHQFDALHCDKTGVLNARALDEILTTSIRSALERAKLSSDALLDAGKPEAVAVIAFDLDSFKQINDSHGHDYGDIVLMAFATRVTHFIADLKLKYPDLIFSFGRPGGEEFTLLVTGSINSEILKEIAEGLRVEISRRGLPDDDEYLSFPSEKKIKGLVLPIISERRVTASIGISSILLPLKSLDLKLASASLKKEADAAVYKAKNGGKNTVRYFPEIRSRYGTVIAHHEDVDVVVIDLGKNVEAAQGQEFMVYHPDFSGGVPVVKNDGRSSKTIGYYPRRSSGRILIFESQSEISFCTVTERSTTRLFPVGSLLEIIPLGAISHLLQNASGPHAIGGHRLGQASDFQKAVKDTATDQTSLAVTVFSIRNVRELESSRGSGYVNSSLIYLLGVIGEVFPMPAKISQIGPTLLAVLAVGDQTSGHFSSVKVVVERMADYYGEAVKFGAGAFISDQNDSFLKKLDLSGALDFARYAASDFVLEDSKNTHRFESYTATEVVRAQRLKGSRLDALADYERLKSAGVNSAYFENQAGLAYLEGYKDSEEESVSGAALCFQRALEINGYDSDDRGAFTANLALCDWLRRDYPTAFERFEASEQLAGDIPQVYHPIVALTSFEVYMAGQADLNREDVKKRLQEAIAKPSPRFIGSLTQQMRNALAELNREEA